MLKSFPSLRSETVMSRPLPTVFDQALASAVRAPSPHNPQPPGRYSTVTSLVRRAESLQANDLAFQAEAAFWTRRKAESPDGVPTVAAGPPHYTTRVVSMRASHENQDLPPREFEQEPLL